MKRRTNGRSDGDESLIDYRNRKAREFFRRNEKRLRREHWNRKSAE